MKQRYEYKFIRIGEGWGSVKRREIAEYQNVVHIHAKEGWRLVQIFAPGLGIKGTA